MYNCTETRICKISMFLKVLLRSFILCYITDDLVFRCVTSVESRATLCVEEVDVECVEKKRAVVTEP
jgi:hypothetical protein